MAEWINAFQTANPDVTIDYQANGSGAGIQDFINDQTAFGGSDAAISGEDKTAADARCTGGEAINIPMVGGAIAVAYNVEGVDTLTLTPDVIAGIFNSTITTWNDPQIADLNAGVALPSAPIAQFHRSDESGTTANFADYLSGDGTRRLDLRVRQGVDRPGWPGLQGQRRRGLLADLDARTRSATSSSPSSSTATSRRPASTTAPARSRPPQPTRPRPSRLRQIVGEGNDLALQLDPTIAEAGAYPIVLVTYEITCSAGLPAEQLDIVKPFLQYAASTDGQGILEGIGYVPITGELLTKVEAAVEALA